MNYSNYIEFNNKINKILKEENKQNKGKMLNSLAITVHLNNGFNNFILSDECLFSKEPDSVKKFINLIIDELKVSREEKRKEFDTLVFNITPFAYICSLYYLNDEDIKLSDLLMDEYMKTSKDINALVYDKLFMRRELSALMRTSNEKYGLFIASIIKKLYTSFINKTNSFSETLTLGYFQKVSEYLFRDSKYEINDDIRFIYKNIISSSPSKISDITLASFNYIFYGSRNDVSSLCDILEQFSNILPELIMEYKELDDQHSMYTNFSNIMIDIFNNSSEEIKIHANNIIIRSLNSKYKNYKSVNKGLVKIFDFFKENNITLDKNMFSPGLNPSFIYSAFN